MLHSHFVWFVFAVYFIFSSHFQAEVNANLKYRLAIRNHFLVIAFDFAIFSLFVSLSLSLAQNFDSVWLLICIKNDDDDAAEQKDATGSLKVPFALRIHTAKVHTI